MDAHLSKDELSGQLPVAPPHLRVILGGRMDHGVMDDPFVEIPEFEDARNRDTKALAVPHQRPARGVSTRA
jgi:hypothetical protein